MTDDRLWDEDGRVWHRQFRWLDRDEVDRLLPNLRRLVVHRYRAPLLWLSGNEATDLWARVRPYTQTSEEQGVSLDPEDFTYAAALWTSEQDRLLVIEQFC